MRIISRTELCAMPSGTLYHEVLKSEAGVMHPLNCKMSGPDVERNDWTYFSLGDYEWHDTDDLIRVFDSMKSTSVPMSFEEVMRDCIYDKTINYMVYERDDVERIIAFLQENCLD